MDDAERLRQELRAAREELVRKRAASSEDPTPSGSELPLMPGRDEAFLRLALMSVAELESHIDRLERDLEDLEAGFDPPTE